MRCVGRFWLVSGWRTPQPAKHSHAALLIAQGEHPKVIQSRLGHASITTTLDTYGHLFEGLDEDAADRLDAAIEPYVAQAG